MQGKTSIAPKVALKMHAMESKIAQET